MRNYKFKGLFVSSDGHQYQLEVNCMGFIQAFFLLTADAIRMGRHYQLKSIENEKGSIRYIEDILKVGDLIN